MGRVDIFSRRISLSPAWCRGLCAVLGMLVLALSSCRMLMDEDPALSNSWYVSLPSDSDEGYQTSNWKPSDVVRYRLNLLQDDSLVLSKDGVPGAHIELSELVAGEYTVTVTGYNASGDEIADGSGKVSLVAGKTANISITMTMHNNENEYRMEYAYNSASSVQGTLPAAAVYKYNDDVTVQFPALTRTGYVFDSWNTKQDGSGSRYERSASSDGVTFVMGTESVVLYAQWTACSYSVVLSAESATTLGTGTVRATYDAPLPKVEVPSRIGYDFGGYFAEEQGGGTRYYTSGGESAASWDVAGDTTLYAKWIEGASQYTVRHYQQNPDRETYSLFDEETLSGTTGSDTEARARTYRNFHSLSFSQEKIKSDRSTVVEIRYDRDPHTVTFLPNGGTGAMPPQTVWYRSPSALSANAFTRTGWSFSGWSTSATSAVEYEDRGQFTAGEEDAELYAQWTANEYTLTLFAPEATADGTASVTATFGSAMPTPISIPSRTGYTFDGFWSSAVGGTQYYTSGGESAAAWDVPSDSTLYARWIAGDAGYTVRHWWQDATGDGSTLHETETLAGTTGRSTAAVAKTYDGFTEPTVTQATVSADGSTVVDIYYTRRTFTVTYSPGSGTTSGVTGMPPLETHRYGASVRISDSIPARSGYAFNGWHLDGDTAAVHAAGETVLNEISRNVTLTAVWSAVSVVSVTVVSPDLVQAEKSQDGTVVTLTLAGASVLDLSTTRIDGKTVQNFNDSHGSSVSASGNQLVCDTASWTPGKYQIVLCSTINGIPQSASLTVVKE